MRLEYTCSGCRKQNIYKGSFATRGDLQMKVGDEVKIRCVHCGLEDTKHINRIHAVVDNRKILLGLGISIVVAIASFFFFGGWGFLVIGIPMVIWYHEMAQTRDFNGYKIRRR